MQSLAKRRRVSSSKDVQAIQNLIERCLQRYMSQKEVMDTLLEHHKIKPCITQIVWQKLEEENPDFFRQYHVRLMVKHQIMEFNKLLEQQANYQLLEQQIMEYNKQQANHQLLEQQQLIMEHIKQLEQQENHQLLEQQQLIMEYNNQQANHQLLEQQQLIMEYKKQQANHQLLEQQQLIMEYNNQQANHQLLEQQQQLIMEYNNQQANHQLLEQQQLIMEYNNQQANHQLLEQQQLIMEYNNQQANHQLLEQQQLIMEYKKQLEQQANHQPLEQQVNHMPQIHPTGGASVQNRNGSHLQSMNQQQLCFGHKDSDQSSPAYLNGGSTINTNIPSYVDSSTSSRRDDPPPSLLSTQDTTMPMTQGMINAETPSFINDTSSQSLNDPVLVDADTSRFGFLGQTPRNSSPSDLTDIYAWSSDVLKNFDMSEYLSDDVLDSSEMLEHQGDLEVGDSI